jgi:ribosomal protein S18 acetylase RimI-like enzyme
MNVSPVDVIRWGRERVRTGPWRGDWRVAFLAPLPDAPPPSADFVRRCLRLLADRGFSRVVTAALSPMEQPGFLAAGFQVAEELHLLTTVLADLPPLPAGVRLTRVHSRQRKDVLAVDQVTFSPFWQFDEDGLEEALCATPRTRFRAAWLPGDHEHPAQPSTIVGYAICGRSGASGFVQRLAVHPHAQRHGIGRALLLDGLHWMRRRGVRRAVVNTQLGNDAALNLYRTIGFHHEPSKLSVLSAGLT